MNTILKSLLVCCVSIIIFGSCAPTRVVVRDRPAAPFFVRPSPPYANAVWIDGEWKWRRGRYEYLRPHYVTPRRGRAWIPGHWTTTNRGNIWYSGRWR